MGSVKEARRDQGFGRDPARGFHRPGVDLKFRLAKLGVDVEYHAVVATSHALRH